MAKAELIQDGKLAPCPSSPNCVCSMEDPKDKEHYFAPANVEKNPISKLIEIMKNDKQYTVLEESEKILRAEHRSKIFRFTDDVIFLYDDEEQKLHFRSSSRVGHSDLGANRKRIRGLLKQLGLELSSK